MPRRVVNFMSRVRHYEPFWAELWSGIAGIAWGAYSYLTPEPLSSNPVYSDLTATLPPAFWELGAIAGGLAQIACVVADKRCVRWYVAFLMATWWGVPVHAILTSGGPVSPAVAVYAAWIGANCTTVWCLAPWGAAARPPPRVA